MSEGRKEAVISFVTKTIEVQDKKNNINIKPLILICYALYFYIMCYMLGQ